MIQQFFQSDGKRIKCLTGTSYSFYNHKRCFLSRLHQCFLQKILSGIAWGNSIGFRLSIIQLFQIVPLDTRQMCFFSGLIRMNRNKLIFKKRYRLFCSVRVAGICIIAGDSLLFKVLEQFLRNIGLGTAMVLLFMFFHLFCHKILGRKSNQLCF